MPGEDDEIVVDAGVAEGMDVRIGDSITIGAGSWYELQCCHRAPFKSPILRSSGSLFPADPRNICYWIPDGEGLMRS